MMRDRGAPHAPPFAQLNGELRSKGPGKPVLLLDLDALDANIDAVKRAVAPGLSVRVVAKSLPSLPLLRHAMERLGTRRLMVFDETIALLSAELPDADLLLGKPLPVQAAAAFYDERRRAGVADPGARVRWLVDGADRLAQYAALARTMGLRARVNLEVDIGLHRGGVATAEELRALLATIAADPAHLEFAGLMAYEPHVASAPPLLSSLPKALGEAVRRFADFKEAVRAHDPALLAGDVVWNAAGSKTYALHEAGGPADDIALGSCLVKPTDFDVPTLAGHVPAVFIAAPVLKRLSGVRVPFLEWASRAWAAIDPNRRVTYFIFGGHWMAKPVSPEGLSDNPLYGHSTNQAMLNGSERTGLSPDDWVFFRPTQSERVLQDFGSLRLVRGGRLEGQWSVIPFQP